MEGSLSRKKVAKVGAPPQLLAPCKVWEVVQGGRQGVRREERRWQNGSCSSPSKTGRTPARNSPSSHVPQWESKSPSCLPCRHACLFTHVFSCVVCVEAEWVGRQVVVEWLAALHLFSIHSGRSHPPTQWEVPPGSRAQWGGW